MARTPAPTIGRRRTAGLLMGLLAVAMVLPACGEDDGASGSEASDSTRTITVYSGRSEELVGDLVEQFTKDTGIEVDLRPGDSGELAAQILTEGDASPADVFFSQDAGALGALEGAGLLRELDDEQLQRVDERFRSTTGTWVGTSGRSRVIVYNPSLVEQPPTSIDQVLDPAYRGRIGYAPSNASFQSFVTALRVLRGEDGARQWLEKFAEQDPTAFENNVAVRDAVDAGDVALGLVNHYYLYEKIAEEGADRVVAKNQFLKGGDAGGLVNVAGVGILKTSSHTDAAERFVEYLLSDTAQRYFATETFEYPLIDGVDADPQLPPLDTLDPPALDLSDLESIGATQELLADVGLLDR